MLDRKGIPGDRLEVTLTPASGAGRFDTFAESSGRFSFKNVPGGAYVVTVRAPEGYEDGTERVTLYDSTVSTTYSVTVTLKPRAGARPAEKPAVPVLDASVPKKAREAYEKGVAAANKNDHEKAIERFREAVRIAPTYGAALNDLGVELLFAQQTAEAAAILRRAVDVDDKLFAPHLNLTLALYASGDVAAAAVEVTRALELDPKSTRALCMAGQIDHRLGNLQQAVERLKKAMEAQDEMQAAAAFALAHVYESAGDVRSAAEAYRLVTVLEPDGARSDQAHARLRALGAEQ